MMQNMMNRPVSPETEQSIQNCLDCHDSCLATIQFCLQANDDRVDLSSLLACAELCQTCANVMQLNSQLQSQLCALCVEACETCANDCERTAYGDQHLLACAEVCRRCAESCYYMVMLPMYSVA